MTKQFRKLVQSWSVFLGVFALAIFLAGCETTDSGGGFAEVPGLPGPKKPVEVFHVGDLVLVDFSSTPGGASLIPKHEERVKDDGTISPPHVGSIKAAGRTALEIEKEIQEKLDKTYRLIKVTVKPGERFFHVDGEVNRRGPAPYLGETDVVKAISAAGGFTDFAKKTKIRLIHPDGKTEIINYNKAVENPAHNVPVYPGDKIVVRRRLF